MEQDDRPQPSAGGAGPTEEEPAGRPPGTNLAAVAGAIILIGLIALALYHRARPRGAAGEPPATPEATAPKGTAIAAVLPVRLTPEASIIAERYRCVCGCGDLLNVCTCNKTPGSNDMKKFLQGLTDQKKSAQEIDAAMVEKYGPAVLLANAASVSSPRPAATPAGNRSIPAPRGQAPKARPTPRMPVSKAP